MGTQKEIAKVIKEKEADYVLAVKGNHGVFNEMVEDLFSEGFKNNFKNLNPSRHNDVDKGHGRLEKRTCIAINVPKYLKVTQRGGLE